MAAFHVDEAEVVVVGLAGEAEAGLEGSGVDGGAEVVKGLVGDVAAAGRQGVN